MSDVEADFLRAYYFKIADEVKKSATLVKPKVLYIDKAHLLPSVSPTYAAREMHQLKGTQDYTSRIDQITRGTYQPLTPLLPNYSVSKATYLLTGNQSKSYYNL